MMKEYNVQVKVRNNYLLQMMRERGYETAAELSRATGVSPSDIGDFLNLKEAAIGKYGVRKPVFRICEILGCEPEDIFPKDHLYTPLQKNKAEVLLGLDDIKGLVSPTHAESLTESLERSGAINDAMEELTTRERSVLEMRHGFDGPTKTLKEIANELGLSGTRIRDIEQKALRKLRHPKWAPALQEYAQ